MKMILIEARRLAIEMSVTDFVGTTWIEAPTHHVTPAGRVKLPSILILASG
jgi:hypothetical protein